jgi:hypothetical protein
MSTTTDQMKKALREIVVPRLRERGFTGSFPHFRRRRIDRIDLLTFQFNRHGGGFIIEIGQCPPEGYTTYWGKPKAADEVTAWDLSPRERARVQPQAGTGTDSWFCFDDLAFSRTAEAVLPFIEQAERMWVEFDKVPKIG